MSGPSAWWPVPADVGRWYDDETRAAARRYHRPAEIADGLALAAQAIGLVVVVVAARGSADRWTVAIAVVAVAVAPPLAVEVWREYVHRPRFGERPVPPAGFVLAAVGRGLAAGFVVVGLTVAVEWAVAPTVAASVATVVAVHGVGSAVGGRVTLATHRVVPADPALTEEVVAVADILGLDPPDVRVVGAVDADRFEPNAFVVGRFGRARVVAVTPALAEGPADVRRFVIAHELGHVRRHHLGASVLVSIVVWGSAVAVGLAVADRWSTTVAEELAVAAATVGAGALVAAAATAWWSRALERVADRDAAWSGDIEARSVAGLHRLGQSPLEPTRLTKLGARHPAPAERWELIDRVAEQRRMGAATG